MRLWRSVLGPPAAPALLVLHGITASHRYWTSRIRPLATQYRLLIPDLPGFGRSPKPSVDYTTSYFIDALLRFLEELDAADRPLRILGHSLGAVIGLELAKCSRLQVERLALLNMPLFPDAQSAHRIWLDSSSSYRSLHAVNSLSASWSQFRRSGLRLTARTLRRFPWSMVPDTRRFTFRSLTSTLEHCLLDHRVEASLGHLPAEIPALLVHGDRDLVAPLSTILELCQKAPFPRLHVIPGAGHNLFHTHHAECISVVSAFMAGAERLAPPSRPA